jgi:hypothetical protein
MIGKGMYGDRGRVIPVDVDGQTILVEVANAGGDAATGGRFALTDLKDTIARVARQVSDAVAGAMPGRPTRCGVEFGVKLAVESNALVSVIAKASAEATVVIKLEWDYPAA